MIGSLVRMRSSVDAMELSDPDRSKVRGLNAARILGLGA
jgi:hypothetical protein